MYITQNKNNIHITINFWQIWHFNKEIVKFNLTTLTVLKQILTQQSSEFNCLISDIRQLHWCRGKAHMLLWYRSGFDASSNSSILGKTKFRGCRVLDKWIFFFRHSLHIIKEFPCMGQVLDSLELCSLQAHCWSYVCKLDIRILICQQPKGQTCSLYKRCGHKSRTSVIGSCNSSRYIKHFGSLL